MVSKKLRYVESHGRPVIAASRDAPRFHPTVSPRQGRQVEKWAAVVIARTRWAAVVCGRARARFGRSAAM